MKFILFVILVYHFGSFCFAQPCRVPSGAPIGDASVWSVNPFSVFLTHPTSGESLTLSSFSVSPQMVHVYRVDDVPQIYSGTCAAGSMINTIGVTAVNDRYFGVFISGAIVPTYNVTYNYTGNPYVTASDEPNLTLGIRNNNSIINWGFNGVLDIVPNTIVVNNVNSKYGEYDLTINVPLPIELFDFNLSCYERTLELNWSTSSEVNNDFFEIEKSSNGYNWEVIGLVDGVGNSQIVSNYSFQIEVDNLMDYYRLKQTDLDGQNSYSEIIKSDCVNFDVEIYPNPIVGLINVSSNEENYEIELYDCFGNFILSKNSEKTEMIIDLEAFSKGTYFLHYISNKTTLIKEIIKL